MNKHEPYIDGYTEIYRREIDRLIWKYSTLMNGIGDFTEQKLIFRCKRSSLICSQIRDQLREIVRLEGYGNT